VFTEPSPLTPLPPGEGNNTLPSPLGGGKATEGRTGIWSSSLLPLRTSARQWLGPLTLFGASRQLAPLIQKIQPDLVHAMRIPYEGMLAALAKSRLGGSAPPLVISVWGNDFTLHARANPWMAWLTRRTLHNTNGLHTDCTRDQRLARQWGYDGAKPMVLLPAGGGIQLELFHPPQDEGLRAMPIVINPRGFRAYVRNDTFFRAIPLVLAQYPTARFLCPTMQGEPQALRWLDEYDLHAAVTLLPKVPRPEMAALFRQAQVIVSPSTHDGTPNTLMEAMACGCFPVAGDLDSLREWITPGENGLLVDPADPQALAEAILRALREPDLRRRAAERNRVLVLERAEYETVMAQAERFYADVVEPQIRTDMH
jgi:glycosyltransferase involved in cell wall biosynthesis